MLKEGSYLGAIKPRYPNPPIPKHHIPHTNNDRRTPLSAYCRTGHAYQNHKDRHQYRTYECTPKQYLPSSEAFDSRRERVGAKGEHGVHNGGEKLGQEVGKPDVFEYYGAIIDGEIYACYILSALSTSLAGKGV